MKGEEREEKRGNKDYEAGENWEKLRQKLQYCIIFCNKKELTPGVKLKGTGSGCVRHSLSLPLSSLIYSCLNSIFIKPKVIGFVISFHSY